MAIIKRKNIGDWIFDLSNYTFLIILMFLTLYPFSYVLFASVSSPTQLAAHSGLLYKPLGFQIQSYGLVFKNPMISVGYLNTIFYVVAGTIINVSLTTMAAYVLSRKWLRIRGFLTFFIVTTMFISGGLIPLYLLVQNLGMVNTRWALLITNAVSTWNVIITRTYFQSIPDSMEESAKIDGANDYVILFKIMLPLALPIIAVITLFYSVSHWNDWFMAMVFLRKRELYPLQLILREILITNSTDSMMNEVAQDREPISENIKYATIIISTLPILCVYPFLQKYFVKGIMVGAVKG